MKRYLLLSILYLLPQQTRTMENFLQLLSGQQIVRYNTTDNDDRESTISINNQTGKKVTIIATYLCNVRMISAVLCWGFCTVTPTYSAHAECEDSSFILEKNRQTNLAPIQEKLHASYLKLCALKARYNGGKWVKHAMSEKKQNGIRELLASSQFAELGKSITLTDYDGQLVIE